MCSPPASFDRNKTVKITDDSFHMTLRRYIFLIYALFFQAGVPPRQCPLLLLFRKLSDSFEQKRIFAGVGCPLYSANARSTVRKCARFFVAADSRRHRDDERAEIDQTARGMFLNLWEIVPRAGNNKNFTRTSICRVSLLYSFLYLCATVCRALTYTYASAYVTFALFYRPPTR